MADPLFYKGKIRVCSLVTLIDSVLSTKDIGTKVTTPYYLIQGKKDKLVTYKGIESFYDMTKIKDKTLVLVDGNIYIYIL